MATLATTQTTAIYQVTGNEYAGIIGEEVTIYAGYNNTLPGSLSDVCGTTDAFTLTEATEILNRFMTQDGTGFGGMYFSHRSDTFTATPSSRLTLSAAVLDAIYGFDPLIISANNLVSIADALRAKDSLLGMYTRFVLEAVGITGAVFSAVAELISELLQALDIPSTSLSGRSVVSELIKALVGVRLAFPVPINDVFTASALLTLQRLVGLSATDKMAVAGSISSQLTTLGVFEDLVGLSEALISGKSAEAVDILTIRATLFTLLTGRSLLQDTAGLSGQAQDFRRVIISISDKAVIIDPPSGETFTPTQLLNILVTEQIEFRIGWIADDGLWDGYVINTNTNAVSEYQGWDFNSFAEFYGKYLAASPTQGLSQLGGTQDGAALIQATLQTAVTDFGSGHQKRVRSAYLGLSAEGTCYMQVLTDDNTERTYQLVANAPGLGNERVDLARGVQSRYWSFSLESTDGSAWRLDNLEVLPVVLSRRVR